MSTPEQLNEADYELLLANVRGQRRAWQRQILDLQQKITYSEEAERAILLMRVDGSAWPAGKPLIDDDAYRAALRNELAHEDVTIAKGAAWVNNFMATRGRQPSPTGSTVRAAEAVDEAPDGLTSFGLFKVFEQRGWIEDKWTNAEAAVSQAARRAAERGLIARLPDGKFVSLAWLRAHATTVEDALSGASDPAFKGGDEP